jgi:predicted metal-dependent enzyme (double-stranded beta helix superfamily)
MEVLDQFLTDCRDAMSTGQTSVLEVVSSALDDHERFAAAVRERPKPWFFAADDTMTVFCTDGRPGVASAPHDHGTWSVLGCFEGSEESWWHRPSDEQGGEVETIGAGVLRAGQAHALHADVVHSVMNRWAVPNAVVHVYAGNFLASDRHIWDPVTGERHQAGLSEPLAPVAGAPAASEILSDLPALAGTAFAALSVDNVEATSRWLTNVLGLRDLTTHDDTCAIDEQFTYLIEPASLTIVGVHRRTSTPRNTGAGLDHLALRVPTFAQLCEWHTTLTSAGHQPTAITEWSFGTFTELHGPEGLKLRLFVPAVR